ncbi:MAG: response regulator [Bacteroidetes bacterium]|nr:response regulator [Bacteroidota bacterium]
MKNTGECKILVADDDPDQLKITEHLLKQEHYSVRTAKNGLECMDAIRLDKPDILLLDVVLPDISGVDICTIIKNDPLLSSVYIILHSGLKTQSEHISEGLETGADEYIIKPCKNRELLARIGAARRTILAEKKLGILQTRTEIILSEMPDIIMEVDKNKVYTWANPAGYRFFGDDVIGKEASFYFEGEQQTYNIVDPIFHGVNDPVCVESWQRRQDGEKRLLSWNCRVLLNENGKVIGALSTARDITVAKQSEIALIKSEEKFRNLFEHSTVGMSMTTIDGKITVNQAFCDIIGYGQEEVKKIKWQEITHPEDLAHDQEVVRSIISGKSNFFRWEKRYLNKNGSTVWVDVSTILERDQNGEPLYFITSAIDINLLKKTELSLYKLNRTYALLSAINHTIIRIHNPGELFEAACSIAIGQGGFLMAWIGLLDPQSEQVRPVASSGNTGDYLEKLNISLNDKERGSGPTALALQAGKHSVSNDIANDPRMTPWREEGLRLGYRSSAVFPFRVAGVFLGTLNLYSSEPNFFNAEELELLDELAANIAFAIKFAEEEQQRIKAEEDALIAKEKAERSDRLKSVFLANMSHEIRTPMNAIVGFAGLLSDPDLSEENRNRFAGIIQSRSEDLMHIINDLLEISRIESGNATIVKQTVSPGSLLSEMEVVFRQKLERIGKKDLRLIVGNDQDTDNPIMVTDGYILRQVITNLIDNAIKFTESGSVRFGYKAPVNGTLTFYVTDTGIGISPENQEIIFEHFRQVETEGQQKYGGTGLGLSICKGSLALLGGRIWVESEAGKGSTFYFTIPFEPIQEKSARQQDHYHNPIYNLSGKKILIVEDEETNMDFLQIILERTNAELAIAYNGIQLKAFYDKLDLFDLVLLDVRLPDASGWELAKEMKSIRPEIKIIVQTAYAMSADRKKSDEAGCDGFISKPIRKNELYQMLAKQLIPS